jgi:hypothetical protein
MAVDLKLELTRDAIAKGIARFDAECREKPDLPGFDGSKKHRWFIEHEGRQYPVKATVALALGVDRNAFKRAHAILRLEEIGFPVVYRDYASVTPARAWLFQANPKQYDLQGALKEMRVRARSWVFAFASTSSWTNRSRAPSRGRIPKCVSTTCSRCRNSDASWFPTTWPTAFARSSPLVACPTP